ncbi:NAD(P)-dependent alcohol dehydrogenase [Arenibacter aquaticus]|uniref:NAD(P)-dependent alcohol dehydrogenase n=1 Tax=Arenibacter aquaticus TaxID=2489054 RepID=A0A3S0AEN6_9FLAO|nr:NAD(P)-dependent alcohol dehydrogenase [Arenibacter aquaticus]RTE53855.1 NAD(P)-dependent alcohol dehydrogenase [Arenibacter aquaticus]
MKAISTAKYGSPDVLELVEIPKPEPKENEILVRIKAASVTTADTMMRLGKPLYGRLFLGLSKPKHPITGTGFSGVIEAIGKNVNHFQIGDHAFGESTFGQGTNAEYLCIPESGIILRKPKNISFNEAATICDGTLTSWNFLKELGRVRKGHHVLINGSSGSLGTAAVQLAKQLGAQVTGVCSSSNINMVRSLGADHAIDYTKEDFTETGNCYDLIFDTVGKSSFLESKKVLNKNGTYLSPVLSIPLLYQMLWTSKFSGKKAKFSATGLLPVPKLIAMLQEITRLLENNKIKVVLDKTYSLAEVPIAHRYIETGRKKGNVVISL